MVVGGRPVGSRPNPVSSLLSSLATIPLIKSRNEFLSKRPHPACVCVCGRNVFLRNFLPMHRTRERMSDSRHQHHQRKEVGSDCKWELKPEIFRSIFGLFS